MVKKNRIGRWVYYFTNGAIFIASGLVPNTLKTRFIVYPSQHYYNLLFPVTPGALKHLFHVLFSTENPNSRDELGGQLVQIETVNNFFVQKIKMLF